MRGRVLRALQPVASACADAICHFLPVIVSFDQCESSNRSGCRVLSVQVPSRRAGAAGSDTAAKVCANPKQPPIPERPSLGCMVISRHSSTRCLPTGAHRAAGTTRIRLVLHDPEAPFHASRRCVVHHVGSLLAWQASHRRIALRRLGRRRLVERTRQLCRRAPHYEGAQRLAVHRPPLIGRRFYGVCLRSPHPRASVPGLPIGS